MTPVFRVRRVLGTLAVTTLGACALHPDFEPVPGRPPDLAVLDAVVARVKARPPHRGFPLAIAPATVRHEPTRYPLALHREFDDAAADLLRLSERVEPLRTTYVANVPVRQEGVYDPYDVAQYLLIRLSPVGFNADSSRAVVVAVFDCGPGCGSQAGFGLRRQGAGWRVTEVRAIRVPAPAADPAPPASSPAAPPAPAASPRRR